MPAPHRLFPRRDPAGLQRLRERVQAMERFLPGLGGGGAALGAREIDAHLPWGGLPRGALHEILASGPGAATGFCAALAARLARKGGQVLWCESARVLDAGRLYAPGLARFGLDPKRLIVVRTRRDEDALWAMEEGLRCSRLAAVVGEVGEASLTAGRRLQLAAEAGGGTALLLAPDRDPPPASAATTRWRVASLAGGGARWQAELFRCRGGEPRTWIVEWCDATGTFAVPAPVRYRPVVPQPARLAG